LLESKIFSVVRQRRRLPDGTEVTRDTVQHPGAVVVIPLLGGDRVCLLRNYRIAVDSTLIELPAGTLNRDEAPHLAAARELTEETGYTAAALAPLATFLMSPGILNERMHVFVASGLSPGATKLEVGEELEQLEVGWEEALQMVDEGRIQDAKTIAAILLYDRRRRKSSPG
jgi:ADP-ribose pyrophosphatase